MGQFKTLILLATTSLIWEQSLAFVVPQPSLSRCVSVMAAGGNKKRRRRKEAPTGSTAIDPIKLEKEAVEEEEGDETTISTKELSQFDLKPDGVAQDSTIFLQDIEEVAQFNFKNRDDIFKGIGDEERPAPSTTDAAIPLPDIREARQKKLLEEELARMEEEKELSKPKIKRSDRAAFMKLLEQQPFSDADDSLFEEEEYTTISALLGERSAKFIGIPAGPIQVGHFIGALGILLMAFVEYPGFPLTNLPTPLRGALQGGK
ncbi:hypothetical protein FisN_30Lh033 [Fistulifera solaris]|uniref:Uncharacterized protein n=1 Tax=Fistulifera solaris TaxID=1519565 RepID=A0A1Z5JIB3_FISSO|nr:hypothetical protein FisN_30Lh033 [Fistulifera solaris]|eukprot:GAX13747.1 hypothetical protein FisN_30Lh033 [Fistulifera solaris]